MGSHMARPLAAVFGSGGLQDLPEVRGRNVVERIVKELRGMFPKSCWFAEAGTVTPPDKPRSEIPDALPALCLERTPESTALNGIPGVEVVADVVIGVAVNKIKT